ncbi:hypothetical protein JCM8097_009326 [Rhodosporidiobolus ruineniae]
MPSASVFASSFTLITADSHKLEVDPLVLAGTSTVFRDMLKDGTGEDKSCTVSETKDEVERYLRAVEKGKCPEKGRDWYSLFTMADKYDSTMAKLVLKHGASTWFFGEHQRAQSAYAAAILLDDQAMAEAAALPALASHESKPTASQLWKKLPEVERLRLDNFGLRYLDAQRAVLLSSAVEGCMALPTPHTQERLELIWTRARASAQADVRYRTNPGRLLRTALEDELDLWPEFIVVRARRRRLCKLVHPRTLVSADGKEFKVDPLVLGGTSKVFADMIKSGTGEKKCDMSESSKEVEVYLQAVEKGECPVEENEWDSLFAMADKYDSEMVKAVLFKAINFWVPDRYEAAMVAALRLEADELLTLLQCGRPIELFQRVMITVKRNFLVGEELPSCVDELACTQPGGSTALRCVWLECVREAGHTPLGSPAAVADPVKLLGGLLLARAKDLPACKSCREGLSRAVAAVATHWEAKVRELLQACGDGGDGWTKFVFP